MFEKIELNITYKCDNHCSNCSTLCSQAPCDFGDISLQDIEDFIKESVEIKNQWKNIRILGGEPTLHKNFLQICKLLLCYKNCYNKDVNIVVCSNSSNNFVIEQYRKSEELGIKTEISFKIGDRWGKSGRLPKFIPTCEAPIEVKAKYNIGCWVTNACGIGKNYLGYFPCSPLAAAARVFNYNPCSTQIKNLDREKINEAMKTHCPLCGFSRKDKKKTKKEIISPIWKKSLLYKHKKEIENLNFEKWDYNSPKTSPGISFFTACQNRTSFLEKTLSKNIDTLKNEDVEFVVVNYNSKDNLKNVIRDLLLIENKKLNYYEIENSQKIFHFTHAFNIAARLCSKNIICLTCADYFVTKEWYNFVIQNMKENNFIYNRVYNIPGWQQSNGYSAFWKSDFIKMRGFGEDLKGHGYEETDLYSRARLLGLKGISIKYMPQFFNAICHEKRAKANRNNRRIKKSRRNYQANPDGFGKVKILRKNFEPFRIELM